MRLLFPRRRNGFLHSQQSSFLIEGDVSFCARERPVCAADVCLATDVVMMFSCCTFKQNKTHTDQLQRVTVFYLHIYPAVNLELYFI